jgi:hypothetical protein
VKELNDKFRKNPLAFFKEYAVTPPNDLGQTLENLSTIFSADEIEDSVKDTAFSQGVQSASTSPLDTIRWIDFNKASSAGEPGAVTFSGTKTADAALGRVPVHFLPWSSLKIVSLHLPEFKTRDTDTDRNPSIFFTAAISGCSVFVQGDPAAPQVFHAGINGTLLLDAASFWRECLGIVTENTGPTGIRREVNKNDYTRNDKFMKLKRVGARTRTPGAEDFLNWLESEHRDELTISEVSPWGSVFGIRYGRLWSFYLQENATVTTVQFIKKKAVVSTANVNPKLPPKLSTADGAEVTKKTVESKGFFGKSSKDIYSVTRRYSQPMTVSEFFPGGRHRFQTTPLYRTS